MTTEKTNASPSKGEGDRESARRYNKKTEAFVEKKGEAAKRGPKVSRRESEDIAKAEKAARKRLKETDPQVTRDYKQSSSR